MPGTTKPSPPVSDLSALLGRTFRAALFDLDGTLVDSTPAVIRAWTSWAVAHDLQAPDLTHNHGRPAADLVARMLPADRVDAALADFQRRELADVADVVPLPGAVDLLSAVGPGAAVVTSGVRPLALARLAAANITPPAITVTFDDVEQGKPHPEPFLLATQQLEVDPRDCLVIEDAPAGISAAVAAGCATLAVLGTHTADQLAQAEAIAAALTEVEFLAVRDGFRVASRAGGATAANAEMNRSPQAPYYSNNDIPSNPDPEVRR